MYGLGTPIEVPRPSPGRHGLLNAATQINDDTVWLRGVEVAGTASDQVPAPTADDPCETSQPGTHDTGATPNSPWRPFYVHGWDPCTTALDPQRDRARYATEHLTATMSHQVEAEFAFLAATGGTSEENPGLWSDVGFNDAPAGAYPIGDAVARIDALLSNALTGGLGVIHTDPYTAARAVIADAFHREGDRYRTPNGHLVAIGTGYAAGTVIHSGPGVTATPENPAEITGNRLYATPPVFYRLGELEELSSFDRSTNTHETRVQQLVLVWSDISYRAVVEVAPPSSGGGGGGGGGGDVDGGSL